MRRLISFLFLLLMLLQAIPVLHFFSSQPAVFYVSIDEEKPDEKSKEKKEGKECLTWTTDFPAPLSPQTVFQAIAEKAYRAPVTELLTPPPDACGS